MLGRRRLRPRHVVLDMDGADVQAARWCARRVLHRPARGGVGPWRVLDPAAHGAAPGAGRTVCLGRRRVSSIARRFSQLAVAAAWAVAARLSRARPAELVDRRAWSLLPDRPGEHGNRAGAARRRSTHAPTGCDSRGSDTRSPRCDHRRRVGHRRVRSRRRRDRALPRCGHDEGRDRAGQHRTGPQMGSQAPSEHPGRVWPVDS